MRAISCDLEPTATDVLSAHEPHLEKLVREERWKRLSLKQKEAAEGHHSDAEVLGVCHRPGCAKTLIGQRALERRVEVSEKEPRRLSNVRPVKFRRLDDSI